MRTVALLGLLLVGLPTTASAQSVAEMRAELDRNELHLVRPNLEMPPIRFTATFRAAREDGLIPSLARMAVEVSRSYATSHKKG